jgi:hypothetical protein
MSKSPPYITAVLTAGHFSLRPAVAVGIQTSADDTHWAVCTPPADPPLFTDPETAVLTIDQVETAVRDHIAPLLTGRPLTDFHTLFALLDQISESMTVTRPAAPHIAQPELSRRELMRGEVEAGPPQRQPRTEQVVRERPLHPALKWALNVALLTAVAAARKTTIGALLAQLTNPPAAHSHPALVINVDQYPTAAPLPAMTTFPLVFGYSTSGDDVQSALGEDAKRMQRHLRQVREWLQQMGAPARTMIQVDVQGGLEKLYPGQIGKVLGTLYGWQHVCAPYRLRVVNPGYAAAPAEQIAWFKQLRSYVAGRRMNVQLVADQGVNVPVDVERYVDGEAADLLLLDVDRLGTIANLVTAAGACRARKVPFVLRGYDKVTLLLHLADALGAAAVQAPPLDLLNGMARWGARPK